MDYAAEQEMEIEALEAIFGDGLEKYGGTVPDGWAGDAIYKVILKPTDEDEQVERSMALDVLFAYTETYPDEAPRIRIQSSYGLSDDEVAEVRSVVDDEVQMNLGMAMMFHIFETAKEWLRNRANVDTTFSLTEEEKKRLREEEEEKRMAEQRSHGIPVTIESFAAWKVTFDEEMRKLAAKKQKSRDPRFSLPTGKELFMQRIAQCKDDDLEEAEEEEEEEDYDEDDDEDEEDWTDAYLAQNA